MIQPLVDSLELLYSLRSNTWMLSALYSSDDSYSSGNSHPFLNSLLTGTLVYFIGVLFTGMLS